MLRGHGCGTACCFHIEARQAMICCQWLHNACHTACRYHQARDATQHRCIPLHSAHMLQSARQRKLQYTIFCAHQSTQSSQAVPSDSIATFFKAVELLSLASSFGLQAYAMAKTYKCQSDNRKQQLCQSEPVYQLEQPTFTDLTWLSHIAVCALIATYIFGRIHGWVSTGR